MEVCSRGHEEIVHDEYTCPLCTALADIKHQEKDHATEIRDLKDQINDMENQAQEIAEMRASG